MKPLLLPGVNAKTVGAALFSTLRGTFQQWLAGAEPETACDGQGPLHQPTPAGDSIVYKSLFANSLECVK